METLELVNGNNQIFEIDLPKIVYITKFINDVALHHISENTGLWFEKKSSWYEAQPINSQSITKLLMTYNFKTRYYNNSMHKNELHLKSDHHVGFDVDHVCFDCLKKNNIKTMDLKNGDRLSC